LAKTRFLTVLENRITDNFALNLFGQSPLRKQMQWKLTTHAPCRIVLLCLRCPEAFWERHFKVSPGEGFFAPRFQNVSKVIWTGELGCQQNVSHQSKD
jgi:hypothetical protein